jgi:selenocysteine lyase/cysteine desulfurase
MNIKSQFPLFKNHPELVYLDNAATVQKPGYVLDEVQYFLTHEYANIHRGSYPLALAAEEQWDRARMVVASALGAWEDEIVRTHNATHSSNLLVQMLLKSAYVKSWDTVVVGLWDHHATIVPRQEAAKQLDLTIVYLPFDQQTRQYDWSFLDNTDLSRCKVIHISIVSNVTGQIIDQETVKNLSKKYKSVIIADCAQRVPHAMLDVNDLNVDFAYFTGHKCGALTWIGVLRWKKEHRDRLSPGEVWWWAVQMVDVQWHSFQSAPDKFEPWTPNVVWAVSLRASFERIASLANWADYDSFRDQLLAWYTLLADHEHSLIDNACTHFLQLQNAWKVKIIWSLSANDRLWVFSWHPTQWSVHDLARRLWKENICIRSGAHCAYPFHHHLQIQGSARMSLWAYNDMHDLNVFFEQLKLHLDV